MQRLLQIALIAFTALFVSPAALLADDPDFDAILVEIDGLANFSESDFRPFTRSSQNDPVRSER